MYNVFCTTDHFMQKSILHTVNVYNIISCLACPMWGVVFSHNTHMRLYTTGLVVILLSSYALVHAGILSESNG